MPKLAVLSNLERTFVIKVEEGVAKWVDVQKGDAPLDQVQIFGDIQEGDLILKVVSEEIAHNSTIKTEVSM